MLLVDVAATVEAVAATSGRTAKAELLAGLVGRAGPGELPVLLPWLSGSTRQRRTGLGWAALPSPLPPAAGRAVLTVAGVDQVLSRCAGAAGPGSTLLRRGLLLELLTAATPAEQSLLVGLVTGELRQGAQAAALLDAVARAGAVPLAQLRRAVTLSGDPGEVAVLAMTAGPGAVAAVGLRVGRPLSPMLAAASPDLATALHRTGAAGVEWKLDGVRVQVHRDGTDVAVFTRSLEEITSRVPEVVRVARGLPGRSAVLDGELLLVGPDGRPAPFQQTASRVSTRTGGPAGGELDLRVFDVLHLDGQDLLDAPGDQRRRVLTGLLPEGLLVPRTEADPADPDSVLAAQAFAADALARGHEGVVVKAQQAPYAMGRRGAAWVKVKPRHTLDLVVLAAERGHGRRTGWLSNLHLGARDPDARFGPAGSFVMLGKTFKGLTDAMLAWQTERLEQLAVSSGSWRVDVAPELVVEIAFDGVQRSPRYPAGVALRFARVLAHRPDKPAAQADTIDSVLALLP